jgi:hypothetical protein
MISRIGYGRSSLLLAAGISMASIVCAHAQALPSTENSDAAVTECPAADTDTNDCDAKDADGKELDWSLLNVDASTLTAGPASKARLAPQPGASTEMSWSSSEKPNGSAAVSVKQAVSPFLDTRIGADMTVARQPSILTSSELLSEKLANGGSQPQSSGTAWAAITAPGVGSIWDKTAVEARLDPAQEQSKLGTSLSKSLPLTEQYSLTLQNGYNVIQQGMVPVPGIPGHPVRNYETDQTARLSIAPAPVSSLAGRCRPRTTNGSARSAPNRNCSTPSASRARSAKPYPAPRTRASPPGSSAAGKPVAAGFNHNWGGRPSR